MSSAGDDVRRAKRWGLAVIGTVLAYLLLRDSGNAVYDDSYFFKRFALNALDHGVFAWNVPEGPV